MKAITTKLVRATDHEHTHYEVYSSDGDYLGYIIRNTSQAARVGENWNFVSKGCVPNLYDRTKKLLEESITNYLNNN